MGRVAAAYGVSGWLKIQPFTSDPEALRGYETWWLSKPGHREQRPCRMVEARRHGAFLVAKLEGIDSREQAAAYRGTEIVVPRDALPEANEGEVYLSDLAGCAVVDREGRPLGIVAEVTDNGAQPILRVVSGEGDERLIPFVAAYVLEVDLEASRIGVDWEADY
jgi:16S rRNA processing protein RimM